MKITIIKETNNSVILKISLPSKPEKSNFTISSIITINNIIANSTKGIFHINIYI